MRHRKPERFVLALVTAPSRALARKLARKALESRFAACANLIPGIESHYWWNGKLETGKEVLLIFKTTSRCLRQLQQLIVATHPYETPEFVALNINSGSAKYLAWINASVKNGK